MAEICIKIDKDTHDQHMKAEVNAWLAKRKSGQDGMDTDIETHFRNQKTMGHWLLDIYQIEASKRSKFFSNPNHLRFLEAFYTFVQKRAAEMGYHYRDVVLMDTSITDSGYILMKVVPRPGAQKIGVETND